MSLYVRKKVHEFVACAHKNSAVLPAEISPLIPISVEPKVVWRIHMDLMGPLKPVSGSGNGFIVIDVDAFSKYVEVQGIFFF